MQDVATIIQNYTGFSRRALDYSVTIKRIIDAAKQPSFTGDWSELAGFVDVERFVRVGNFKEVMNWTEYTSFLTAWAPTADWECSFKRVTEKGNLVFLELEERTKSGQFSSVVNSLSLYEFDTHGKLQHIDIYLQMPMPDPAMLQAYEGVDTTA